MAKGKRNILSVSRRDVVNNFELCLSRKVLNAHLLCRLKNRQLIIEYSCKELTRPEVRPGAFQQMSDPKMPASVV